VFYLWIGVLFGFSRTVGGSKSRVVKMAWGTYESGRDKGCGYCKYDISLHKTSRLELNKPFIEKGTANLGCRENKAHPNCGYEILKYFRSICPPEQKLIFCYEMKGALSTTRGTKGCPYGIKPQPTNPPECDRHSHAP
jgi:hypothetical protein